MFAVRAGRPQVLDVLSNDMNVAEGDSSLILVGGQPTCGDIGRLAGWLQYRNSDACGGQLSFTYCVPQGDTCPSTTVTLNVSMPEALDGRPQIATSAFPTLRAITPQLGAAATRHSTVVASTAALKFGCASESKAALPSRHRSGAAHLRMRRCAFERRYIGCQMAKAA